MTDTSAIGSLARVMKGKNKSTEVKRGLRNSILLPMWTDESETWTWKWVILEGNVECKMAG